MRKNVFFFFILSASVAIMNPIYLFAQDNRDLLLHRPQADKYCFDYTRVVPSKVVKEVNETASGLRKNFDIDFVVVVIPSLKGQVITDYAVDLFSKWRIGKETQGKKGILILIAMQEKEIKIEVGYDLEQIYTDMYIGQMGREMLKEFLEQADWEKGFLATIENFVERAYHMYKKGIDVKDIFSAGVIEEYYSGGAGAKGVFDFGVALNNPLPPTPKEVQEYFGAQPTPQLAFERYMEFCAKNLSDYKVDLFSDLTKYFYSHWSTSSGQRRSEAEQCSGKPYIVRIKDNHAAVIFPDADIEVMNRYAPYFMIKTEKGWQLDMNTMARALHFSQGLSVHWVGGVMHPYVELFLDKYNLDGRNLLVPRENDRGLPDGFAIFRKCLIVPRVWLGIYVAMTTDFEQQVVHTYCVVLEVYPGSPAYKAGLRPGDILLSLNKKENDVYPLSIMSLISRLRTGNKVNMKILRNLKDIKELTITAEETSHKGYF